MKKEIKDRRRRVAYEIVILGGGLSGLAAANYLLNKTPENIKLKITILEKLPYLGGLASSFKHDGYSIPKYYHHIVSHNNYTQKYFNKYDLLDSCEWQRVNVAIAVNKQISQINKIFGLLTFKYLNLFEKIRFGLFGLWVLFLMNPNKIPEDMNAEDWLIKRSGKSVTKKVWDNLYARNKFNIGLDKISAKQFANRLKEREVYDLFTFPKKGLQPMIDGLEKDIKGNKGLIFTSVNISSIDVEKRLIKYTLRGQTSKFSNMIKADYIINTIPIPEFRKISNLPKEYDKKLSKLRYCPAVGITFGTKKFLDENIYWFNFFEEDAHVLMQHSILNDNYKDKVNWILRYGGSHVDLILTDEQIKTKYFKVLNKYFDNKIEWAYVFRETYAEPIYDKEYASYMPDYKTPVEGLYMAGIQVTYPKIRNMNSALESGEKAAKLLLKEVSQN